MSFKIYWLILFYYLFFSTFICLFDYYLDLVIIIWELPLTAAGIYWNNVFQFFKEMILILSSG